MNRVGRVDGAVYVRWALRMFVIAVGQDVYEGVVAQCVGGGPTTVVHESSFDDTSFLRFRYLLFVGSLLDASSSGSVAFFARFFFAFRRRFVRFLRASAMASSSDSSSRARCLRFFFYSF